MLNQKSRSSGIPYFDSGRSDDALALHGIVASVLTRPDEDGKTTEVILDEVARHRADLLVKGAYTHAQVRQMIFGGVTRYILEHAQVPVLMAH